MTEAVLCFLLVAFAALVFVLGLGVIILVWGEVLDEHRKRRKT